MFGLAMIDTNSLCDSDLTYGRTFEKTDNKMMTILLYFPLQTSVLYDVQRVGTSYEKVLEHVYRQPKSSF
jgi:hypothetical protein